MAKKHTAAQTNKTTDTNAENPVDGSTASTTPTKRSREKQAITIQVKVENLTDENSRPTGGVFLDRPDFGEFPDTAAALKYLADNQKTGEFRIIVVKRTLTAKAEQQVKIVFA